MEQAMSNQEVFDKVVNHLRKQGRKSLRISHKMMNDTICAYRGNDGCKCAAGILITDEEYSIDMEGNRFVLLLGPLRSGKRFPSLERYVPNSKLIEALQGVHDCYAVHQWEGQFQRVAKNFGLVCASV